MSVLSALRPRTVAVASATWRPGLRGRVLVAAAALVVGLALVVAESVSGHLRETATDGARSNVESIVRGYVDPALRPESLLPGAPRDPAIDAQLERLTLSADVRRINLWGPDGTIAYSSIDSLRGRRTAVGQDLARAFGGMSVARYASRASADPGRAGDFPLPERYLEIFVPIRGTVDGAPIGVYDVFIDARPIEEHVEATRRDVFLLTLVAAMLLICLLWLAFSGASRRLAGQNRLLREQAETARRLAEQLRRSEERFRSVVRNSSDVILIVHRDGTVGYASPAVERVLGYEPDAVLGGTVTELVHDEDRGQYGYFVNEVLSAAGAEATAEFRLRHGDGTWRVLQAVAKNLIDEPAVGGIVVAYRDMTERTALEAQLRHQAFHDGLTGLANRALFSDRLEHALARSPRERPRLGVLFLDLDDFKAVNDSLGHPAGDRLLRMAADRLRASIRPGDTAARMGGDEFAVLVEDADDASVLAPIADRVLDALRTPFQLDGHELAIHASIGIAVSLPAGQSAEELLRQADLAMYVAKGQGKDRAVVYEPTYGELAVARHRLKGDMERGFAAGEFRVVYQPIIELASGRATGVEALLRWDHPTHGPVSPAEFIPLAEETGLVVPLGRWILREACLAARAWSDAGGRPLEVSVNVSARQIESPDIVDDVAAALSSAGLAPGRLTLEITESVLMREPERTVQTLERLKALGVRLAIDDFGTGYSSLSYLRQFPVDILKIDRSFVATLGRGGAETALVESVVRLAKSLELETVAEGIEEDAQLGELISLGAGHGQGYLFARPMEAERVRAILRTLGGRDELDEFGGRSRSTDRTRRTGAPSTAASS